MKHIFLILVFFSSNLYGQRTTDLGSFKFNNCKVLSQGTEESEIAGVKTMVNRIDVVSRTLVQVACHFIKADYDTTENNFTILNTFDSTGVIRDSIISQIRNYWGGEEKLINKNGVFEASTVSSGFLTLDTETYLPFIKTSHEKDGAYFIVCVGKNIYKVILTRGTGFGCLSSYLEQNFNLFNENKKIEFVPKISKLKKIKELLNYN